MTSFSARYIGRDTWLIQGEGCDSYLLLAEEEACLIDTGCARENIRAFAQSLTSLPVRSALNTHSHFDHTGGNGWFETVYATAGIARSAKNTMGAPRAEYPLDYAFTLVRDGDVLPFAGRPIEVLELDCHSPGDIVLLDRSRGLLFCGDEVEAGQVLLLHGYAEKTGEIHAAPAATVEAYRNALGRMRGRLEAFDRLSPPTTAALCPRSTWIGLRPSAGKSWRAGKADRTSPRPPIVRRICTSPLPRPGTFGPRTGALHWFTRESCCGKGTKDLRQDCPRPRRCTWFPPIVFEKGEERDDHRKQI